MPEFDFEWEILGWDRIRTTRALSAWCGPPAAMTMGISHTAEYSPWNGFGSTVPPKWTALPRMRATALREGSAQPMTRAGNLEVRLPTEVRGSGGDGNFGHDYGFSLQPGLLPHVGDRIHIEGVDCGEHVRLVHSNDAARLPPAIIGRIFHL